MCNARRFGQGGSGANNRRVFPVSVGAEIRQWAAEYGTYNSLPLPSTVRRCRNPQYGVAGLLYGGHAVDGRGATVTPAACQT